MTPYYDKDGATIYLGDSLEVLRALRPSLLGQVNAIVMDPPYASGARRDASRQTRGGGMQRSDAWADETIHADQMTTAGFVWLMRQVAVMGRSLLQSGAAMLSFIDWRQWPNLVGSLESCDYRVSQMVVWDKVNLGMGSGFRNQHELICHASNGTAKTFRSDVPNVIAPSHDDAEESLEAALLMRHKRERNTVHPSMKPVGLMRELVSVVAPAGGLVVDPFMGAGATLLACRDLGVRAIGIEVVEEYAEAAAKRLDGFTPANETGTDAWQGGLGL